ncbi:hypothetical protein BV20DRAFT_60082 [Pilatotrama ljubarskyi]|nr:hypothetical protein BV20DRAFT_60082 [Pilatotrama ljubarskyi]
MVDAFTTTDVVLAVIGTLLGLIPVTVWIIGRSLPSYKLRILEDTLQETESLLRTCVEEGRFVESQVAVQLGGHLRGLRERTNDLRVVTSGAKTYVDDIRNMIKGFSRQSDDLCEEVKEVRAKISQFWEKCKYVKHTRTHLQRSRGVRRHRHHPWPENPRPAMFVSTHSCTRGLSSYWLFISSICIVRAWRANCRFPHP